VDYPKLSRDILPLVGGGENISSFTNCMTRLRLEIIDPRVDVDAIKKLDGVMGVVDGDQLQVVVGPGHAQRLRDAFGGERSRGHGAGGCRR
jgi:PTS system sucrose-specific IIC component